MKTPAFEENIVLFGADSTPGIVAVERVGEDRIRIFRRRQGAVEQSEEPFHPFMLLEEARLVEDIGVPFQIEPLSSENPYRFLVCFGSWGDCLKARSFLQRRTQEPPSSPQAPYLFLPDPVHQFLLLSGKTFFKGMDFGDLHRLALDIETDVAPGYEFSNPHRPEDRILSIAMMDNRGHEEVLFGREMDEREMLEALGDRIVRLDPDVLEGHNLFNFDLDYIVTRARMHGVGLPWGRDGSEPKIRRSRFAVAERTIDYTRMEIFGRQVVDTLFLLQYYDMTARELESYGLKAAARHFGLTGEDRTYIARGDIQLAFRQDPEALRRYNLDDVRETLALSELLGYSFFLQARIFPYTYQNIFVRGNATKINALFLREYLRQRASVPKPKGRGRFEGGYTDVFRKGVVRDVVHFDVTSLYPSILLTYGLRPKGDTLDVFLPLLRDLRAFRLEAKKLAQEQQEPRKREYYQALQQTFKILINSFYGYLGTEVHHFAEPQLAGEVTRRGREILRDMIAWLEKQGAKPVEIDTDGIYFVPPPRDGAGGPPETMVERLSSSLPEGIEVELDGRYSSMFSYKRKNYVLMDPSGKMIVKGSALRSRGMERYLREFLSEMIRLLLEGRGAEVGALYDSYSKRLADHRMDISWLAKTETLSESPEIYREKVRARKRNAAATYELALRSGRQYRAGDQVSYYVTGRSRRVRVYENCKLASEYDPDAPDENVEYYQAKLSELLKKFQEFLPEGIG